MNHRDRLLERLKDDTNMKLITNQSVRRDTVLKILECTNKRAFNKITQKEIAKMCGVSLPTIKRFENLKVDSLTLFKNYVSILEDLPNKKKRKVPKWVYCE